MRTVESVKEMQELALTARGEGRRIAFVPTMGFLHEGHASLMRAGWQRGDLLVASIFVNPTQFGPHEDFATYPRNLAGDRQIAAECGVDILFTPTAGEIYPPRFQTFIEVTELTRPLCGASRPGHFRGVTTVVAKLLNIVQPHLALFGRKDYQQLATIRQMVADLNMPVEIVGMPTIREPDGLAMSSRNAYLSPDERQRALALSRSLAAARQLYRGGEQRLDVLRERVLAIVAEAQPTAIDYAEFRDGDTLEEPARADARTLLALAVRIGTTRLIDNCQLGEDD